MIQPISEFFGLAAKACGLLACAILNLSIARSLLMKSSAKGPVLSSSAASLLLVFFFALALHLVIR